MSDPFGIGAIVEGISSAWQADKQADMADHAMHFSADEARINRDFQERMSNTAWQRGTADMMAAGINPMLAYMKGGASTPSGGQGSSSMGNVSKPDVMGSVASAAQAFTQNETQKNIAADTAKKEAEKKEIEARTPTYAVSMEAMKTQIDHTIADIQRVVSQTNFNVASAGQAEQQTRNLQALLPQIEATIAQMRAQTKLTGSQDNETKQRIAANLPAAEAALKKVQTDLQNMQRPQAGMKAAVYTTPVGAFSELLKAFTSIMHGR